MINFFYLSRMKTFRILFLSFMFRSENSSTSLTSLNNTNVGQLLDGKQIVPTVSNHPLMINETQQSIENLKIFHSTSNGESHAIDNVLNCFFLFFILEIIIMENKWKKILIILFASIMVILHPLPSLFLMFYYFCLQKRKHQHYHSDNMII